MVKYVIREITMDNKLKHLLINWEKLVEKSIRMNK